MMLIHFCGSPFRPNVCAAPYQMVMTGAAGASWKRVPAGGEATRAAEGGLAVAGAPFDRGGMDGSSRSPVADVS